MSSVVVVAVAVTGAASPVVCCVAPPSNGNLEWPAEPRGFVAHGSLESFLDFFPEL